MAIEYQLYCTACSFETTVEGLERAFEKQANHERQQGTKHFVEFKMCDKSSELFPNS